MSNSPTPSVSGPTIAARLATFVADLTPQQIPPAVLERARHLILDAVGIAYASTHYDFAHRSLSAMTELSAGAGDTPVIGLAAKLSLRDAMLMNGILIHGLDYDDTHAAGVIHATASTFPCALGAARAQAWTVTRCCVPTWPAWKWAPGWRRWRAAASTRWASTRPG